MRAVSNYLDISVFVNEDDISEMEKYCFQLHSFQKVESVYVIWHISSWTHSVSSHYYKGQFHLHRVAWSFFKPKPTTSVCQGVTCPVSVDSDNVDHLCMSGSHLLALTQTKWTTSVCQGVTC